MSRSFARFLAGATLAAVLPMAVQAQNSCVAVAGNCNVVVTGSVTIPAIAKLNADLTTANFTLGTNGDWATFFNSAAVDTTVVRPVALTLTSNTTNLVQISGGAWSSASWAVGDVKWAVQTAACGQVAPTNTLTGTNASLMGVSAGANPFAGTAGANQTRNLCLGLTIPNDLTNARLTTVGAVTIPITLQVSAP